MPAGIGRTAILGLVRETRRSGGRTRPLRLYGERADELQGALAAAGDAALIALGGDAADASAIVCLIGGEPSPGVLASLRTADLRGTPAVAVRLDGTERAVPYVLATDVVAWRGDAPPVEGVAARLAARLRRDGRLLAARLPALRPAVERVLVDDVAVRGAVLAAVPRGDDAVLPALSVMQARLLLDLEVAQGGEPAASPDEVALAVGPRLGLSTATGVAARAAYRSMPRSLRRLAGPALAYAGTRALGALAPRLPLPR